MKKEEKLKRILARGEHSNHSHVLFGSVDFLENCFRVESPDYQAAEARYKKYENDLQVLRNQYSDKKDEGFQKKRIELQDRYNQDIERFNTASIRHILESNFLDTGVSVWTKEHVHVPIKTGTYKFNPQIEYNPLNDAIEAVRD